MAVNPDLNVTYNCEINGYQGIIATGYVYLTGVPLNATVQGTITLDPIYLTGKPIVGVVVQGTITGNEVYLEADIAIEQARTNWVGWSKIGSIVFKQDRVNDSGYRPLPWKGTVFCVKRLGKNVVAYGTGGVTLLYPVDSPAPTFGMKEMMNIGALNKNCVCGTGEVHFFIDKHYRLWKVSEGNLGKLGYEEFLSTLSNPSMIYDEVDERVYISDSVKGFTYTPSGMGGGYGNLTGIQYSEGYKRVASPGVVGKPPAMEIVTDIVDLGYRGMKTIESIHVGVDVVENLYVALDYRYDKKKLFKTSAFVLTNREGVAFVPVTALEFRVRVKNSSYDPIDIDYIRINFKRVDIRFATNTPGVTTISDEKYDN